MAVPEGGQCREVALCLFCPSTPAAAGLLLPLFCLSPSLLPTSLLLPPLPLPCSPPIPSLLFSSASSENNVASEEEGRGRGESSGKEGRKGRKEQQREGKGLDDDETTTDDDDDEIRPMCHSVSVLTL